MTSKWGTDVTFSSDNLITFSEYSVGTLIPIYSYPEGDVSFNGRIVVDLAQPSSPAVAANASYIGIVKIQFETAMLHASFDAGYFDNLGSSTVFVYAKNGTLLHSATNESLGILHFDYSSNVGIGEIQLVNILPDINGFSLDNLQFSTGAGADSVTGTDQDDVLLGGNGDDYLAPGAGVDTLDGGAGIDDAVIDRSTLTKASTITTGAVAGVFEFSLADGTTVSGIENLTLTTGSGDDSLTYVGGATKGSNHWDAGGGVDTATIDFSAYGGAFGIVAAVLHDFAPYTVLQGPSNAQGGPYDHRVELFNVENVRIFGGSAGDSLFGYAGNDLLVGGAGDDQLVGGAGNDELIGGEENDYLDAGAGIDTLNGGAGIDDAYIDRSKLTQAFKITTGAVAGVFEFTLPDGTTVSGIEHLNLTSGAGDDSLTYIGGATKGYNSWDAGAGNDTASIDFSAYTGAVSAGFIFTTALYTVGEGAFPSFPRQFDLANVENFRIYGGSADDSLSGDAGNDLLVGGGGDDQLVGGAGSDELLGGEDNDYLDAGAGVDILDGGAGIDDAIIDRSKLTQSSKITTGSVAGVFEFALPDGTTVSGIEHLTLTTGSGDDSLTYIGGATKGYNSWDAGAGNDTATIDFSAYAGVVSANFNGSFYTVGEGGGPSFAHQFVLFGVENLRVFGGAGNDDLRGEAGNDELVPRAGSGDSVSAGESELPRSGEIDPQAPRTFG